MAEETGVEQAPEQAPEQASEQASEQVEETPYDPTRVRRFGDELTAFWRTLKGDRPIPLEGDLDLDAMGDMLSDTFMLEVEMGDGEPPVLRYSYIGDSIIEASLGDGVSRDVYSRLIAPYSEDLIEKFNVVLKTGEPVTDLSEFLTSRGTLVGYCYCLVPLAFPGGDLGYILGGLRWGRHPVFGDTGESGDDSGGWTQASEWADKDFSAIEGMDGEEEAWAELVLEKMDE